jgi:hypothetical protein
MTGEGKTVLFEGDGFTAEEVGESRSRKRFTHSSRKPPGALDATTSLSSPQNLIYSAKATKLYTHTR